MKYYEDRDHYFLSLCQQQLTNIATGGFDAGIFINSWYKLSEFNERKYSKPSIQLFRNWMNHIDLDSNGINTARIIQLMDQEISSDNFEKIFLEPLLIEIKQIFNVNITKYSQKCYFFYEIFTLLIYQKLIPQNKKDTYVAAMVKHGLSTEEIKLMQQKEHFIHEKEWKIVGSITPLYVNDEMREKIIIMICNFHDHELIDDKKKKVLDCGLINHHCQFKKLKSQLPSSILLRIDIVMPNHTLEFFKKLIELNQLDIGNYRIIPESIIHNENLADNTFEISLEYNFFK